MEPARTNNLSLCFQEVLTAIVRVRYQRQQVADAGSFRTQMRQSLQTAMQDARSAGYSGDTVQTAVFAVVAFLDESVLNLQSPAFSDWARRPLQEELFGGHLAGEAFFRNFNSLLTQPDSQETADALELHCLCLEMGYRGRYALGGSGELERTLRQALEKIQRTRGPAGLGTPVTAPEVKALRGKDAWSRGLLIAACVLAVLVILAFIGSTLTLGSGASRLQNTVQSTSSNAQ